MCACGFLGFSEDFIEKSSKKFAYNKKIYYLCTAFQTKSRQNKTFGEMVEWSITTVLKTVVLRGTGGSNPSLSANFKEERNTNFGVPFFVDAVNPSIFNPPLIS